MILLWRITTNCNFACGFCAYDRRRAIARTAAHEDEVERVALLAAELAHLAGPVEVAITHIKPGEEAAVSGQIAALGLNHRVRALGTGEMFGF